MTDKNIRTILIVGAFVLTLGLGSVALNGVDDTLKFISGVISMVKDED